MGHNSTFRDLTILSQQGLPLESQRLDVAPGVQRPIRDNELQIRNVLPLAQAMPPLLLQLRQSFKFGLVELPTRFPVWHGRRRETAAALSRDA